MATTAPKPPKAPKAPITRIAAFRQITTTLERLGSDADRKSVLASIATLAGDPS